MSFGWLSIFDLNDCEFPFTDKSYLQNFLKILIEDIMEMFAKFLIQTPTLF